MWYQSLPTLEVHPLTVKGALLLQTVQKILRKCYKKCHFKISIGSEVTLKISKRKSIWDYCIVIILNIWKWIFLKFFAYFLLNPLKITPITQNILKIRSSRIIRFYRNFCWCFFENFVQNFYFYTIFVNFV